MVSKDVPRRPDKVELRSESLGDTRVYRRWFSEGMANIGILREWAVLIETPNSQTLARKITGDST